MCSQQFLLFTRENKFYTKKVRRKIVFFILCPHKKLRLTKEISMLIVFLYLFEVMVLWNLYFTSNFCLRLVLVSRRKLVSTLYSIVEYINNIVFFSISLNIHPLLSLNWSYKTYASLILYLMVYVYDLFSSNPLIGPLYLHFE